MSFNLYIYLFICSFILCLKICREQENDYYNCKSCIVVTLIQPIQECVQSLLARAQWALHIQISIFIHRFFSTLKLEMTKCCYCRNVKSVIAAAVVVVVTIFQFVDGLKCSFYFILFYFFIFWLRFSRFDLVYT